MDRFGYSYFLFDYADVLSLPQDQTCVVRMAQLLDFPVDEFRKIYWEHRRRYDLGHRGRDYWSAVAGRELPPELVSELIVADTEAWGRINQETVRFVQRLKRRGHPVGVLSNLPRDLARAIRAANPFFNLFDHVFFSAEIALVKPDPEAYAFALREIGVDPGRVLLFDDNEENLAGARAAGMGTYLFGPGSAERLLAEEDEGRGLDAGGAEPRL
jgi:putative hydrolase of the HAD superfamily